MAVRNRREYRVIPADKLCRDRPLMWEIQMLSSVASHHDHQSKPGRLPVPHILPALGALVILLVAIIVGNSYGSALENRYIHALAPLEIPQSRVGNVLQMAVLHQTDLLLVFGSSEMEGQASPYRALNFFASYPTGFEIFNISNSGENPLEIAQDLAALGPALKGKRIVISFTPSMFDQTRIRGYEYRGNFSRMDAYAVALSPYLSMDLKQLIAKRMMAFPESLGQDMLLTFIMRNLSKGGLSGRLKYMLIYPLGQLDALVIRLQDHYAVWGYLQANPEINLPLMHQPQSIDWEAQLAKAEAEQKAAVGNNPYGIENDPWKNMYHQKLAVQAPGSADQAYLSVLENSQQWGDLKLVLEICQAVGARPLLLSRPINGQVYAATGISAQAQAVYYSELEKIAADYHVALVDFKEYTNDKYFSIDGASHTSRKGWVIVDQVLDAFYHNKLH
jgi:D-alanine transfer protein